MLPRGDRGRFLKDNIYSPGGRGGKKPIPIRKEKRRFHELAQSGELTTFLEGLAPFVVVENSPFYSLSVIGRAASNKCLRHNLLYKQGRITEGQRNKLSYPYGRIVADVIRAQELELGELIRHQADGADTLLSLPG
jgi:hypothetical protein